MDVGLATLTRPRRSVLDDELPSGL